MSGGFGPWARLPLLAAGFVALAFGVGAGLARAGWAFPLPDPRLLSWHGPLMICGFFGTVIGLERAVALADRRAYLGPLATALGVLALVAIMARAAMLLFLAGSLVLFAASVAIFQRQRALFTLTPALGAACWALGTLLMLSEAGAAAVPWWIAFLVLTIAGERLELSRLLPPSPRGRAIFACMVAEIIGSLVASLLFPRAASAAFAAGLFALALWLARYDIARRTVREKGLTRFVAVCLLSGFAWLGAGGLLLFAEQTLAVPGARDAGLHAILLGFVFSMVFGHAPIIFPAVTRAAMPYHWSFYVPLVLLAISLALRIAGDLADIAQWRRFAAAGGALALLLFVVGTVSAVARGKLGARAA